MAGQFNYREMTKFCNALPTKIKLTHTSISTVQNYKYILLDNHNYERKGPLEEMTTNASKAWILTVTLYLV
jgi:hypothetical protein